MAGFLTPAVFNQEIVSFFTDAEVGPLVEGSFIMQGTGHDGDTTFKSVPDVNSLRITNRQLNQALSFTQPTHPSYRVISPGSLIPLFALHAYYEDMKHVDDKTRLSASSDMRRYLRRTMIEVIEKDIDRLPENERGDLKQRLIDCIDDPTLNVNTNGMTIFNPNCFLYAHFSKIISAGKIEVREEGTVSEEQGQMIALARAYKNNRF